jgi:hypothetical protein
MKTSRIRSALNIGLGAAAALVMTSTAQAHHSFAMFDMTKQVTLQGVVKSFQYTNPHIWIQVVVTDPATGKEVEYAIEGGSPNNLSRAGWTRGSLKAGEKATVVVHPLRSGEPGGSLMGVTTDRVHLGV